MGWLIALGAAGVVGYAVITARMNPNQSTQQPISDNDEMKSKEAAESMNPDERWCSRCKHLVIDGAYICGNSETRMGCLGYKMVDVQRARCEDACGGSERYFSPRYVSEPYSEYSIYDMEEPSSY